MSKTPHPAAEFKDSPRYAAIRAVFDAIDLLDDDEATHGIIAHMNRVTQGCNAIERDRLPEIVRRAIKERRGIARRDNATP